MSIQYKLSILISPIYIDHQLWVCLHNSQFINSFNRMAQTYSPNIIDLTFIVPLKKPPKNHSLNFPKYLQQSRRDIRRVASKEQITQGVRFSHLIRSLREPIKREKQKIENGVKKAWISQKRQQGIVEKDIQIIEGLLRKQCVIRDAKSRLKNNQKVKTDSDQPQLKVRKKRHSFQKFVHQKRLSDMSQSIYKKKSLHANYQSVIRKSTIHQTINQKIIELKESLNTSKITIPSISKEGEKNKQFQALGGLGILGIAKQKDQYNIKKGIKCQKKKNRQRSLVKQKFQIINIQTIKQSIQTKYFTIEDEKDISFTESIPDNDILQSHYLE